MDIVVVTGDYVDDDKGPSGNVEAGTITTIANTGAVAGLESVTNRKPFTGGRERETDEE